jgi:hypothetical protein
MGLIVLTLGYIAVASLLFAAVAVSSQPLWAFPVLVSLWTAFLWMLMGRSVAVFSTEPHRPRRVTAILVIATIVAVAALAVSVMVGLVLLGPRSVP